MTLEDLETPALVLDADRMEHQAQRMQAHVGRIGVPLRAHVKTCRSIPVADVMMGITDPSQRARAPITVSTLREAEAFFEAGFRDILYAVGLSPMKIARVVKLREAGCDLTVITDDLDVARHLADAQAEIPALIEIDSDGRRAGVPPEHSDLLRIAERLSRGAVLRGVMTHAGGSYACTSSETIREFAERERVQVVTAAERLRAAGFGVEMVSAGSTPTALMSAGGEGLTEYRAGVYIVQDLVMAGLGLCAVTDIAISVLVTVIGRHPSGRWLVTDGGFMALSRDEGTRLQAVDRRFGLVCDLDGAPLGGPDELRVARTNQEHGLIERADGEPIEIKHFPAGTRLRILPVHACATAAAHDQLAVVRGSRAITDVWPRVCGW